MTTMALDIQGTAIVRKKISTFKSKIQAADKRVERAKESLHRVEEGFNRTMGMKAKLEDQICKRDTQLDRVETLIAGMQGKWKALVRFREETNPKGGPIETIIETQGGQGISEIDTRIAKLAKQTNIAQRKCKASVDREHALLAQTDMARERRVRFETTARALQEQLAAIKERVCVLEQRKQSRNARKRQTELLQGKVQRALVRARKHEDLEAEMENRIIELEDQIEMYTQKKKRASSILAERDSHKSIESWTIALWLRRSSLVSGSSIPSLANANSRPVKDA